ERSAEIPEFSRVTWTALPDLPRLTGPTILPIGRRFFLESPTSILKLGVYDGEDVMTAFAHSALGECVPRVISVVALSLETTDATQPPCVQKGLILTLKPGKPLEEIWPSLSSPQRETVKSQLCDLLLRLRARQYDYYDRPGRKPYVLYFMTGPRTYTCCTSRAEWDESRLCALRAPEGVPVDRVPLLGQVQRETRGADGWDRPVLTHGDLSDRNIIVDPDTLAITGLIDWERANIMPAYFEYVAAQLMGGHEPEWREELLEVLKTVLRRECEATCSEDGDLGVEARYMKTMAAWD
ncbi:uncharacterized protein TRAVEDRAFT_86823, partial [Trametes versicolor FP-101664 SS1]|uniref:uncharacterized protein n=1 Tax=Trametes versicolor (strain FP-101664) TaxID=717944 RepID=UPI0004623098